MIKLCIGCVILYVLIWGGILWLPTSGIDSSLANEWIAYLIIAEEVLSLVCLILVGKTVIYDLKRSVKPSS